LNVLIAGGTGFVGRALVARLRRDGHRVSVVSRNAGRARSVLGLEAEIVESVDDDPVPASALAEADAVVNLAGEPLMGGRWTPERMQAIRSSRVDTTRAIVEGIAALERRPSVLVSSSAVGYYGDGGDRVLTEDDPPGADFLASVCREWEGEASRARELGVRVAVLRTGFVLGRAGGGLSTMLPVFRAGLGGPVGSGRQYLSWIHLDDLVEMIATIVSDTRYEGTFNATVPEPVPFRSFAGTLGETLGRPAVLPAPAFAVKLVFGKAASTVLEGQRAIPARATGLGFGFRFASLEPALRDILRDPGVTIRPVTSPVPESPYLRAHPPSFVLETSTRLDAPLEEVFSFFSRPENLGFITPSGMQFRITELPDRVEEGSEIAYRLRVAAVPLSWRTRIDAFDPLKRFVDSQSEGPYASWWHEHTFRTEGGHTLMDDRVFYAPPLGPVGRLANALFVESQLEDVFGYRSSVMRLRFGEPPVSA